MVSETVSEHLNPRIALAVSVAEAEHDEGEPSEEEQAIQQRAAGKASRDAKQWTLGRQGRNQNQDENHCIYGSIAVKARLAERLGERKQVASLNYSLHHGAAQGKHHKPAVQAVAGMTEKPAQPLIIEDAAARCAQCR